jgi:Ca2+-binding EF-hand superfamily protein
MRFFDTLDLNHDGYINSPENTRYENQVAPEIQRMDPRIQQPKVIQHDYDPDMDANQDQEPNGGKYIKQIVGASQYGLIDEPQPIRAADANFDFRVSKDEWLAASNQRFTILDRNRDGFITANELPQTPAQVAQELDQKDGKDRKNKKKHSGFW